MNCTKEEFDDFKLHFKDEFKVLGILGAGTFGYVCSAIDKKSQKKVAIKVRRCEVQRYRNIIFILDRM